MSLPRLATTSLQPGAVHQGTEVQYDEAFARQILNAVPEGAAARQSAMLSKPAHGQQLLLDASTLAASQDFSSKHLIFKSSGSNALKPTKKKPGHNRGRSLLDISKEQEREARIGKLHKAVAEQSAQKNALSLSQSTMQHQDDGLTAAQMNGDLNTMHGREQQQKHLMQQLQEKNRHNINKALSLTRELKDSLLDSTLGKP